jgi:XTP/dITP diphosphohydrolase
MLLVATANRHKLAELEVLLAGLPVRVVGLERLPAGPPVAEEGATFAQNAVIKACAYAGRAARLPQAERPRWAIADDSGLCVDALGGAPGVLSARYAGPGATYADNNQKLLRALSGVPPARRTARFECAIACAEVPADAGTSPRILFTCEGVSSGRIGLAPAGTGGFGYDPLFIESSSGRTFAELPAAVKNEVSHRGRALREFRNRFLRLLTEEKGG